MPPSLAPLIAAAGPADEAVARLKAFDVGGKLTQRIAALEVIIAALPGDVAVTLDPTERHGFEYQTWLGFSLFCATASGEIGRGGTYRIGAEPAVGFSAYIDPLIDAGLAQSERRRLFLPMGTAAEVGTSLRAAGLVTVAALTENDTAQAQICTHWLDGTTPAAC